MLWELEHRWFFQFFVSILICLNNGACFCFGIFSPFMKRGPFNYSQSDVNFVSTVGVMLSYVSLPTGFLYDAKGPMLTLLVGTVLNFLGWLGMFLIFIREEQPLFGTGVITMCLFYGISQFSASFYETGSVLTNLDAFSCYQGRVVLIQKTFMGLGSSIIVQIYLSFFSRHFDGIGPFFLFLLFLAFTVGVLGTLFVRLPTRKTECLGLNVLDKDMLEGREGESRLFKVPFNTGTGILFILIIYMLVVTLVQNYYALTDTQSILIGVFAVLLCLSFSLMIFVTPTYSWNVGGYGGHLGSRAANSTVSVPLSPMPATALTSNYPDATIEAARPMFDGEDIGKTFLWTTDDGHEHVSTQHNQVNDTPRRLTEPHLTHVGHANVSLDRERRVSRGWVSHTGDNISSKTDALRQNIKFNSESLWHNMKRREIWLMWYVCLASWSSATLVSTNSTQIYESMSFKDYSTTVSVLLVSIYGVASAIGRIAVGMLHPFLIYKKISVLLLLCAAPALNFVGLPLFFVIPQSALVVPFFIVGLATGVSWSSTILIVKLLFAPNNCGKHYSALYTAGLVSPLIFNVALFGPIYDYHSRMQGHWDERKCEGRVCIWISLTICALVNFIAVPLSLYFFFRVTKRGGLV